MHAYVRPAIPEQVFRDRGGAVIDYGNRWGGGSPPEDTYSVDSHPERFAPLHAVADALIAHLLAGYDVEAVDDIAVTADFLHPVGDVVRAVRVTPASAAAARLTFVLSSYPGVAVHAGLLHDDLFPVCGCDACDETWQAQADGLEGLVRAVVAGRFGERVTRWPRPWVHYTLGDEHGGVLSSGTGVATAIPAARRRAARRVLRRLGGPWAPWAPWPRRE